MNPSKNKPSHLRALLRKNWILWQRSWCVSCLEIIVPLLFAAIMVAFRKVDPVAHVPQDAYYSKSAWLFDYDGVFTSADRQYFKDCAGDSNGGMVALVPNAQDTATHNIMGSLKSTLENDLGLTTQIFNSLDDINDFTSNSNYGKSLSLSLCFAVVMDQANAGGTYQYQLIFNTSQTNDDKTDLPKTLLPRIATIDTEDNKTLSKYARSGFLALQNMLDNLILRAETGDTSANIETQVTSRMVEAYTEDDLAANMKGQTRLFIDLPLLLPYLRLLNGIIREKEKKIKEGMKIMGLSNTAFYLSWFITYFIIFTIISILISLILVAGFFEKSTFGFVFLWHWEFSICLMCLAFLVSVFFSKAKQGNVAGFVIALLFGFFQSLADSDNATQGALLGCSLAPQTSVGLAADHILSLEAAGLGLNSDTVTLEVSNYKMSYHYGIMLFDVILFVLLGSYLDQVLPSEFGLRKHPLFCCMRKKKKTPKTRISQSKEDEANMIENADNFEETDPNLKLQDQSNESVMVQNLRKVYASGKVAVDGVSFSMYKSQIFALLGHNGAGKTSTISMITGLFGSTDGTTSIFGMDNQVELEEIRKIMGVCPQHDTLFDSLTVKEHLEMYAVFKGVNSKEIPQEVEKIIEDIGLVDKTDYLSKNLSGGQKRKLSIGIAFIGGSKFIVLDEPSSGMDTSARRKLWDMLKNYKNNRVVLLTTHFMDEADYLGDRIGIMGDGKLKCLGRPLFLKSRFGVGYNLTVVKKDINDPSKPIKDLILNHIPEGKVLSDVSAEVAIQLPLETAPKFQKLFDELDQNLQKICVSSYGISVTTLEEVFLNVAKVTTPEKHFQKEEDSPGFLDNNEDLNEFDLRKEGIKGKWAIFAGHFKALVIKRVHYFKRDKRGLICEVFLPIIMIIAGILLGKVQFVKQNPPLLLSDNLYDFKFPVTYPTTPGAGGTGYSAFISNFDTAYFTMTAVTPNAADPACTSTTDPLCPWNEVVYAAQGQSVLYDTVNVFSIYMDDYASTTNQYKYTTFINTRAQEGSAFAANKINNAILKQATGNSNVKINTIVNSFQKTPGYQTIDKIFEGITFAFVFAIGMSFIPASVITFIVKERELNVKHQQIVSGVSLTAYWLSNYFVDIVKYLIPAVVNALLAMAFDASALIEGEKLAGLWSIFILYGFGITSFVYLISFLFRDYGTAQIASFFFNFGTGFIGGAAISILRLFETTRNVAKVLQWILRPLPTFSMTYGFLNLANREAYALTEDTEVLPVFNIGLLGGDVIFLIGAAFFYMALVFLVEKLKNRQPLALMLTRENNVPYVPKEMDDDVKREELEVEQSDNKTYSIKVDKLRKVYTLGGNKHKVAVDRVSFGVKNGECFALLGVNGAGKTTTFKILSGDYVQTSGHAYINGYSVPNEMDEARKDIGYCPQFDALLENLTAKEHLNLYASIKGIPTHFRQRLVEKQLREMNLKQYENIPAGTYSGGNKRKLSVAIAMIGNPAVVFLDEPSTGMDPEARRFMWNVISRISRERKQSSVILTTHSMEEAEALATKMGIMVNGNLKCMGTSQHIKNKFGGGYEIEVKLNLPIQSQIDALLKNLGYVSGETINKQSVEEILDKMKLPHFKSEIKDDGTGSAIHAELKKGKTTANLVAEWILIETNGEQLKAFLKENFGEMIVIEHFQSFFRFKTTAAVSVGKFFGGLEANKSKLNILQYAIRQSTIEQIFNNFATEKVPVQAGIHTAVPINNAPNA